MRRQSRRYLALRIASEVAPSREKLSSEIENSLRKFFGEYGVLEASLRLIAYDLEKTIAIVRCSHQWVERLRAALALTTRVSEHQAALFVLRSAGTIAALERALSVNNYSRDKRPASDSMSRLTRLSR